MKGRSSWPLERLGNLVHAKYGKALPQSNRQHGAVPVYGSNGVVGQHNTAITHGPAIIIGRKGSSGAINTSRAPCWPIDTTYYVDDPGPFTFEFLEWLLRSLSLEQLDRSTAIPGLNRDQLYDLEVPVPPPSDQRLIVEVLSKVSTLGQRVSSQLSSVRLSLERFRQSVLVAACTGRLTVKWRRSSSTPTPMAKILAQLALEGPRTVRRGVDTTATTDETLDALALPRSWTIATVSTLLASGAFEDVKDGNHGANHPKSGEFGSSGLPFVTANCVKNGTIDYAAAPKVSGKALARLRVGFAEPGDVVLTHKASVGRVAINTAPCVLTPQTTYYRTNRSVVLPEYLAIFFESLYFYLQLAAVMSQTTRDFVPISEQYMLSVILPPLDEQSEIVRRVAPPLRVTGDIEQRIDAAAKRTEVSSKAILTKAFRGELSLGADRSTAGR